MKYPSGKNVIGYSLKAAGNRFFFGMNPALEEEIPNQFVQATLEEVEEACALAKIAFSVYSSLSLSERSKFVQAIVSEIKEREELLCQLMTLETGLPLERAKTELNRSIYQFENYAEVLQNNEILQQRNQNADAHNAFALRKFNVSIGPVVVFGASNFPFAYSTLGGDVASALVAGCPVIVKAHPLHPNTAALSAECISAAAEKTNMPDGVFSQLNAMDFEVGVALLKNEAVSGVGFTGSIPGGKALLKLANERRVPIPVYAEMGSENPVIVCADVLDNERNKIVEKLVASVSLNAGQFCTSPGILFVEKSEFEDDFIISIIDGLQKTNHQVMLGKGILKNYSTRIEEIASVVPLALKGEISSNGIQPSVVVVDSEQFRLNGTLREEVFGSFMCVVKCDSLEDIANSLNFLEGQLTGSIFTKDKARFDALLPVLQQKVGRIIINGVPTGVQVSAAQQHGGPFPSSSSPQTSVGSDAVYRWLRPITIQNEPTDWV